MNAAETSNFATAPLTRPSLSASAGPYCGRLFQVVVAGAQLPVTLLAETVVSVVRAAVTSSTIVTSRAPAGTPATVNPARARRSAPGFPSHVFAHTDSQV